VRVINFRIIIIIIIIRLCWQCDSTGSQLPAYYKFVITMITSFMALCLLL